MEKKDNANTGNVAHSVGNTIGTVRGNYLFSKDHPEKLTKEAAIEIATTAKREAVEQLKSLVGDTPDQAMQDFIAKLEASDWSTLESFLAFRTEVYDPFMGSSGKEALELRNEIFGEPGRGLK